MAVMKKEPEDYANFVKTYKYFLDQLLVDFSQNYEQFESYEAFLQRDNETEKIRYSCTQYMMRRIHSNFFVKMSPSEFDNQALKVIQKRKSMMADILVDEETGKTKIRYSVKERDQSLYTISIEMLKNLPKEETPRAKRKLMLDAFQLALNALGTLKLCGADDEDFIISYVFYFVIAPNKVKDYRPFS